MRKNEIQSFVEALEAKALNGKTVFFDCSVACVILYA